MTKTVITLPWTLVLLAEFRTGSTEMLIGDVLQEGLRGSQRQGDRWLSNEEIMKPMLSKEHFDLSKDVCLNGEDEYGNAIYGQCDIRRFPFCKDEKPNICFNRINRQDKFWPDKHPYYYIDYNRVYCYPNRFHNVEFSCSSCSPGRWCAAEGRCILDENMYHCWPDREED
ncbi:hypothetical protein ACHAXS_008751 [Conticribra weissflogii]